MSKGEFDFDNNGSLMEKIQQLIAPPVSEENKNKKNDKSEHPYFKRPGKGHNHDSCDACGEGGDLICCDKCPASFHLTCHDPPLDESDIPTGQWLCHHCRKTKEITTTSIPNVRSKRSNSSASDKSSSSGPSSTLQAPLKTKKQKLNSMEILVQAASVMNPKQFELPREMSVPCVFPGTDKVDPTSSRQRFRPFRKKPTSNTLPNRFCYECRRSSRVGPLLSCDYCPLVFHLDCLEPPLTALPQGKWMCSLHGEQALDSKLLTSVSLTERVKLWDKFQGPVDQDAVKIGFIRKAKCKNPPFRFKVRLGSRNRVKVPEMVRQHYRNPVPLLPSLRDVLRLETVQSRNREYLEYLTAAILSPSATNQSQTSNQNSGNMTSHVALDSDNKETTETEINDIINGVKQEVKEEEKEIKKEGSLNGGMQNPQKLPDVVAGPLLHSDMDHLSPLLRLLAYQHTMPLPSELLTPADIARISRVFSSPKRPRKGRSTLRARAMLCPVVSKHFYNVRTSEVDPASVRHDASYLGFRPTVSARFPEAVAMRYRSLSVGKGCGNDVELDKFGQCNFTSSKHAIIFYDECTKHYELINYSEHGTFVNNILYSCDTSHSCPQTRQEPTLSSSVRDIVDRRRRINRSRISDASNSGCARMTASGASNEAPECSCGPAGPTAGPQQTDGALGTPNGWEGAALLAHGALLRFGCVTFVFSIVECATV